MLVSVMIVPHLFPTAKEACYTAAAKFVWNFLLLFHFHSLQLLFLQMSSIWRTVCWSVWLGSRIPVWSYKATVFLPLLVRKKQETFWSLTDYFIYQAFHKAIAIMSSFDTRIKIAIAVAIFLAVLIGEAVILLRFVFSLLPRRRPAPAKDLAHCVVCYSDVRKENKKAKLSHSCPNSVCRKCLW